MRMALAREYAFEAAHRLPRVPEGHRCARVHGHSYRITITVDGPVDPERGWVMDFADIDRHVRPHIARLDHQLLNDIPGLENPTSELLCRWLWERIRPDLAELFEVVVSETPTSRSIYRGE
ncbi:MAG TPA: 6-carboxytetrahydropterin synthase QueD [Kofleriaceae bacterium]|nr:6-carboxytetrahydropterin synthase QueD [Kofleriaceae bacterium]